MTVHVRPDKIFGRDGDDLTVTVPVSFTELALGSTLSVPTLDSTVGVRCPKAPLTAAFCVCADAVCPSAVGVAATYLSP